VSAKFSLIAIAILFTAACQPAPSPPPIAVSCSVPALIQAIDNANANPSIDILDLSAGCVYEFSVVHNSSAYGDNSLPVITTHVVINGNNVTMQRSSASGTPNFRFFLVEPSGQLVLRDLTLRNGLASTSVDQLAQNSGGAIFNRGILIFEDSLIDANRARASGGAVMSMNELSIKNSTFTNNDLMEFQLTNKGAAIYNTIEGTSSSDNSLSLIEQSTFSRNGLNFGNEALFNAYGTMFISNSTISSNGAGIDNEEHLTVSYSTIVNNQAFGVFSFQTVQLENSIVAMNLQKDCSGGFNNWTVLGAAMDTDGSCPNAYHVTPAQLALAPLADNGGNTETHALNEGSFAINLAAGSCPPWDQRLEPRPFGVYCDLGAYESPFDPDITTIPAFPYASDLPTTTPQPPDEVLVAIPIQNVNCREGNSNQFEVADTLHEGAEYQPTGRGADNLWVRFNGPVTNTVCWVYFENLDFLLDGESVPLEEISEGLLPFAAYPPLPTPSPTATTFTPEAYTPQCSDGIDNDGDRRLDLDDRECSGANDNDEAN
jgi:hypothetical protein